VGKKLTSRARLSAAQRRAARTASGARRVPFRARGLSGLGRLRHLGRIGPPQPASFFFEKAFFFFSFETYLIYFAIKNLHNLKYFKLAKFVKSPTVLRPNSCRTDRIQKEKNRDLRVIITHMSYLNRF
jgi:hypothetical protein